MSPYDSTDVAAGRPKVVPMPTRPRLAVVVPGPTPRVEPPAVEETPSAIGPALGLAAALKGCGFVAGMLVAKVTLDPSLGSALPSVALAYAVGGAAIGILCAMALVLVLERGGLVRSIVWTLAAALLLAALLIFVPRPVASTSGSSAEAPVGLHLRV